METRTAPKWILVREKRCRRARGMWLCVNVLGWLGWLGTMCCCLIPDITWWNGLGLICPTLFVSLLLLRPDKRARRCEAAARSLDVAIVRYEASPDRTDSMLDEASQRVSEILRIKRIRTAPAWIRSRQLGCRLKILAWISPAMFAVTLSAAAARLRWPWVLPWHAAAFLAAFVAFLVGAMIGTRKLMKARDILGEAMARYEFESAATESVLDEAGQRASEVLSGKSGRGEPMP